MTDITPARKNVQTEEVDYRSPVSEATWTKIGGSTNFINDFQYDKHAWHLNGDLTGIQTFFGFDGIFPFLFDAEIVGFWYYITTVGSSGTLEVDVDWLSGGDTNNGTIFSTLPAIDTTAADGTYTLYRETDTTTLSNPTGHTLAVLSKTDFDAGDALQLSVSTAQTAAEDFQFGIMFRPR